MSDPSSSKQRSGNEPGSKRRKVDNMSQQAPHDLEMARVRQAWEREPPLCENKNCTFARNLRDIFSRKLSPQWIRDDNAFKKKMAEIGDRHMELSIKLLLAYHIDGKDYEKWKMLDGRLYHFEKKYYKDAVTVTFAKMNVVKTQEERPSLATCGEFMRRIRAAMTVNQGPTKSDLLEKYFEKLRDILINEKCAKKTCKLQRDDGWNLLAKLIYGDAMNELQYERMDENANLKYAYTLLCNVNQYIESGHGRDTLVEKKFGDKEEQALKAVVSLLSRERLPSKDLGSAFIEALRDCRGGSDNVDDPSDSDCMTYEDHVNTHKELIQKGVESMHRYEYIKAPSLQDILNLADECKFPSLMKHCEFATGTSFVLQKIDTPRLW